jgi:hypothetical protein
MMLAFPCAGVAEPCLVPSSSLPSARSDVSLVFIRELQHLLFPPEAIPASSIPGQASRLARLTLATPGPHLYMPMRLTRVCGVCTSCSRSRCQMNQMPQAIGTPRPSSRLQRSHRLSYTAPKRWIAWQCCCDRPTSARSLVNMLSPRDWMLPLPQPPLGLSQILVVVLLSHQILSSPSSSPALLQKGRKISRVARRASD